MANILGSTRQLCIHVLVAYSKYYSQPFSSAFSDTLLSVLLHFSQNTDLPFIPLNILENGSQIKSLLIVSNSLLRSPAGPICPPDREARDLCCLLGAKIHDVAKRAPQLAKSMDQYLLLLFHVDANDSASQKIGRIKEDHKVLVRQVENVSTQVLFSSVLLL